MRPICIPAVFDSQDDDFARLLSYSIEQAVGPAARRPDPHEIAAQRLSHSSWLLYQRGRDELDDRPKRLPPAGGR